MRNQLGSPIKGSICLCMSSDIQDEIIDTESLPGSGTLSRLATYKVDGDSNQHDFTFVVSQGSVVDFAYGEYAELGGYTKKSAIVNAANRNCLGGCGVDGAINRLGGEQLTLDRRALKLIEPGVRCQTGDARITGPCKPSYGNLHVQYVIHAVGPNYKDYKHKTLEADQLLHAAYTQSLELAKEHGINAIGFSLISAGSYRHDKPLEDVLRIAVEAVHDFDGYESLEEIHFCAFTSQEAAVLLSVSDQVFSKIHHEDEAHVTDIQ